MHDPRVSTALRQLANLGHEPAPPRWSWAIVGLERIGRIRLPAAGLAVLDVGAAPQVRGRSTGRALILRNGAAGAAVTVDDRGRLFVPVSLRQAAGVSRMLVVGVRSDPAVVVVTPVGVLDGIGDLLVGGLA